MPRALRRVLSSEIATARRVLLAVVAGGVLVGCAQGTADEDTTGQNSAAQPEAQHEPADAVEEASSAGDEADSADSPDSESSPAEPAEAVAAQPAEPAGLQIPSIDVDEDQMVDLEIMDDGRLEEPSGWNDVGWFSGGSRPGEAGPTVIAAHVDSPTGPAVFYRVLEMEEGDEVTVLDAEGEEHVYEVSRTADFLKDDFPTRDVFGVQPDDELRLITCTGEWDEGEQRHEENRVVFASRVG